MFIAVAKQAVIRAGQFSYRDRRVKKGPSEHLLDRSD